MHPCPPLADKCTRGPVLAQEFTAKESDEATSLLLPFLGAGRETRIFLAPIANAQYELVIIAKPLALAACHG